MFEGTFEKKPFATVSYVIYFQELFVFQLKFANWKGFGLRASDAPKRKARAEQSMNAEEKVAKKKREKEAKLERKKQKDRERRDKARAQRQAALALKRGGKDAKADQDKGGRAVELTAGGAAGSGAAGEEGGDAGEEADGTNDADNAKLLDNDAAKADAKREEKSKKKKEAKKKKKNLTYSERIELDKQREEERKKELAAKHEAKLEAVRKRAEKAEAKMNKVAEDLEKKKQKYDPDLYQEASSDPYIIFSIDPPANPGCKFFRTGGYFGRSTRTDMQTNTLNPSWDEARKPLSYLGTRSELENEILHIRVMDWDLLSSDDLIGKADVPLNGLLEYGQVEVELTFDEEDLTAPKVRGVRPKKVVPAGRLVGQILFDGAKPTPEYKQIGTLVEKQPGWTYMGVRLVAAHTLKPADISGHSDPFVTVEWDGCEQHTKVVYRNLDPVWNETLYFPLKCSINKAVLEQKPGVTVRVYDFDVAGPDLLGSCEIPLHKITSAELAKLEEEILPSGSAYKGRVLKLEGQKLLLPEQQIESTIDLWLFFTPDLPLDIVLEDRAKPVGRGLDPDYEQRLRSWWENSLPDWTKQPIEEAQRLENQSDRMFSSIAGEIDKKKLISAEDQDAHVHFFCEYLTPVLPPSELNDVGLIARMVRMMSWMEDKETFRGSRSDVWQAPNFFMELRKGDFEDHAIYLCNLLLGIKLDAYVCVGRLYEAKRGDKRHVWVMVREDDGCVRMWETSTGDDAILKGRWKGRDDGRRALRDKSKDDKDAEGAADAEDGGKKKGRALFGKKKKGGDDKDTAGAAGAQIAPSDADKRQQPGGGGGGGGGGAGADGAAGAEEEEDGEPKRKKAVARRGKGTSLDEEMVASEMELRELLNDDELLSRAAIEEPVPEIAYSMAGATSSDGAEEKARPVTDRERDLAAEIAAGSFDTTGMPVQSLLEEVSLPYAQLEVLFNHENLWASKQYLDPAMKRGHVNQLDPAILTYDLENPDAWEAFCPPRMRADGKPECFYQPRRVSAKPPKDRLRTMEQQIEGEIKSQLAMARAALPTSVNTMKDLIAQLERALEYHEVIRCNPANEIGDKATKDLENWTRQVKDKTPPKSSFRGRAINYAYTDAKKIRKHLLMKCDYASSREDNLEFLVAVKCFGYHGGVVSVWVYFALLDKSDKEE